MLSVSSARLTPLTLNTRLMSDQWPPPASKPGSLRDRVAAYENKRSTSASKGPPISSPELVSLQRKPRPPSPSVAWDNVHSSGCETQSTRGTSAVDAMESIGRSGSLRERMVALQGKGAFGSAPPPTAPKPSIERPERGRLPSVPAPVTSRDESKEATRGVDASGREASRSPPPRTAASLSPERQGTASHEEISLVQGDGGDRGTEEEERQHRAVIAVHMSRLGGAKVGTGPPIVAPRHVIRESLPLPEVKEEALADQPAILEESNQGTTYRW